MANYYSQHKSGAVEEALTIAPTLAKESFDVSNFNEETYDGIGSAAAAVPSDIRGVGQLLTFRKESGDVETWRFVGGSTDEYETESKWEAWCPCVEPKTENVIYIDQTISDPASMITGDVRGDVIKWIRSNSHRYVAQSFSEGAGITLKQLDDSDSTKYADGTDASTDITAKDVFVKLPEFWYYGTEGDQVEIHFTNVNPNDDETWAHWDEGTLIGAYEAYLNGTVFQSVSGVQSSGSFTNANARQYAKNKGTGYQIVDWQMHCVMGILFYAWYGNTNSQAICGSGTDAYNKITGQTNSLGMTDTTSVNGNSMSINFWGLENWWGNKYEWMEGLEATAIDTEQVVAPDPTATRTLSWSNSGGWATKLKFGKYCDLCHTQCSGSETSGYCDTNYGPYASGLVAVRSGYNSDSYGGVSYAGASSSALYANADYGARLCYRGPFTIVD